MQYRTDRAALAAPAVQALVAERIAEGRAPASSFALFAPDGVVASGAAADERIGAVPTADTAFRIASCTKSATAAAVLQVAAEGRLDLHAPLDDLLRVRVLGAGRAPTVTELLSMTGGIPVDDPWADRQESMAAADFDAMLADGIRLVREPGTRYEYSSAGYALLGRVLERTTGTPYPRLVIEQLLAPLGLEGIGFELTPQAVAGYARVEGRWTEQPWAAPGAFSALGGLIATPSGLAGWAGWLAAAWRGVDDAVLPTAERLRMQEAHALIPGSTSAYGFGLVVEEDPRHGRIVSHSGGYPGFGAHMRWHAASGLGAVVLENGRYSGATAPATRALSILLDAAATPDAAPDLWPETAAARDAVEAWLRGGPDAGIAAIASDNLELDDVLPHRRAAAAPLVAAAGLDGAAPPLADAAPWSDSPAHLVWSVPGRSGSLRCEVRMTPVAAPRLQTLVVRLA